MKSIGKNIWAQTTTNLRSKLAINEVRASRPKVVTSFSQLVEEIAEISFRNPEFAIFYRGQRTEHFVNEDYCSIYPSILRNLRGSRSRRLYLSQRYEILKKADELLLEEFEILSWEGETTINKFSEVSWAILQHYEICDTPLIDITASLRVACSFATQHEDDSGVIYVFGLPHTNGSISYYADEEMINLRLLSICPPVALRPHYQEGYLVGTFPTTSIRRRTVQYDLSRRLVAKFRIKKRRFWNSDFHEIPESALFPANGEMEDMAQRINSELESWCSNKGFQPTLLPSRA